MEINDAPDLSLPNALERRPPEDVIPLADAAGVTVGVRRTFSARVRRSPDDGEGVMAFTCIEIPLVGEGGEITGVWYATAQRSDTCGALSSRRPEGTVARAAQSALHDIGDIFIVIGYCLRLLERQSHIARRTDIDRMTRYLTAQIMSLAYQIPEDARPCPRLIGGSVAGRGLAALSDKPDQALRPDISIRSDSAADLCNFEVNPAELYRRLMNVYRHAANAIADGGAASSARMPRVDTLVPLILPRLHDAAIRSGRVDRAMIYSSSLAGDASHIIPKRILRQPHKRCAPVEIGPAVKIMIPSDRRHCRVDHPTGRVRALSEADVTLAAYGGWACPSCMATDERVVTVLDQYGARVRYSFPYSMDEIGQSVSDLEDTTCASEERLAPGRSPIPIRRCSPRSRCMPTRWSRNAMRSRRIAVPRIRRRALFVDAAGWQRHCGTNRVTTVTRKLYGVSHVLSHVRIAAEIREVGRIFRKR